MARNRMKRGVVLGFRSLSAKLLMLFIPLVMVVTTSMFAMTEYGFYKAEQERLIEDAKKLSSVQAPGLQTALWEYNNTNISNHLEALVAMPFVDSVQLVGSSGEIVAKRGNATPKRPDYLIVTDLYYGPIEEPERIGSLNIVIHERNIFAALKERVLRNLLTLLVVTGTIICGTIFATHQVISYPLSKLEEAIERSRNEYTNEPLRWDSLDEIGDVVSAYNEMQRQQAESTAALQRQTDELRQAWRIADDARRLAEKTREELRQKVSEVERFNHLAVGRELRMREFKAYINQLLEELGRAPEFDRDELDSEDSNQKIVGKASVASPPQNQAASTRQDQAASANTGAQTGAQTADAQTAELGGQLGGQLGADKKSVGSSNANQYLTSLDDATHEFLSLSSNQQIFSIFSAYIDMAILITNLQGRTLMQVEPKGHNKYNGIGDPDTVRERFAIIQPVEDDEGTLSFTIYTAQNNISDVEIPVYAVRVTGENQGDDGTSEQVFEVEVIANLFIGRFELIEDTQENEAAEKQASDGIVRLTLSELEEIVKFTQSLVGLMLDLTLAQSQAQDTEANLRQQREAALSLAEDTTLARKELAEYQNHLHRLIEERTRNLEETTNMLQLALSNMSDGIFMLDSDLKFVLYNQRYRDLLRVPSKLVTVGAHFRDMVQYMAERGDFQSEDPIDDQVERFLKNVLDAPESSVEIYPTDGPIVDIHLARSPDGGVVGVASDISERKLSEQAMKEAEERSRMILNSVAEGIFGLDREAKITFVNPSACSLLGFERDDLIGSDVRKFLLYYDDQEEYTMPVNYAELDDTLVYGLDSQKSLRTMLCQNGMEIDIDYSCKPIYKDGNLIGGVFTFQDVSERRRAERDLREKMEELENFATVSVGRELTMIELKREINDLRSHVGENELYEIADKG